MGRLVLVLILSVVAPRAWAQFSVQGLDHVPVVVRDLKQATADFTALGFVMKPGQPHANGLQNAHAKFPDGTEIELISPTVAVDTLSTRYVEWLKDGDGPASFGLYVPDENAAFRPGAWPGVFFAHRQKSPTDMPEHFAHPNGAISLSGVWLAGSEAEPWMVRSFIGRLVDHRVACAPFGSSSEILALDEGEIVFLPQSVQRVPGRPIVALSVTVKSLDVALRYAWRRVYGCGRQSRWVETHGMWLELIQQ
ncbi:MAG TPA: VOC family protein [Reyranella sp.]|nr:VOC family protein [Reyranella sp.]